MKELLIEGKGLNYQERSVWIGGGGGSSAMGIPLRNLTRGNEASETIEWKIE